MNLPMLTAGASVMSCFWGGYIGATHQLEQSELRLEGVEHEINSAHDSLKDLENDRRERDERRVKLASDLSVIAQQISALQQQSRDIAPLQINLHDMDLRDTARLGVVQLDLQNQIAGLSQRSAVIESQLHWIGDQLDQLSKMAHAR